MPGVTCRERSLRQPPPQLIIGHGTFSWVHERGRSTREQVGTSNGGD
jgi:hypothetical protein